MANNEIKISEKLKNVEEIFGKETPQMKAERLQLEEMQKMSALKKEFQEDKNEGIFSIAEHLITKFDLENNEVSDKFLGSEVEMILDTLATTYVIREVLAKIKRKVYGTGLNKIQPIKFSELMKMELPEREYLINGLIPLNAFSIIAGSPSSCKSWLSLELIKAVSTGESLFGKFETTKGKCLLIDEEANLSENKARGRLLEIKGNNFEILSQKGIKFDNENQVLDLLNYVKKNKIEVVLIDSLISHHQSEENNNKESQQIINSIRRFCKANITFIAIAHNRKENFLASKKPTEVLRGASAWLGGLDALISVSSKEINAQKDNLIEIYPAKIRQGKPLNPFKVLMKEVDKKISFEFGGEIETEISKFEKAKEMIKKFLSEGGKCRKEILAILIPQNISARTIDNAIKELKTDDEIEPRPAKHGKIVYFIK